MRYRIAQPPAHSGLWVVQGWFADVEVWGDIGDPVPTRRDAEAKLRRREMRDKIVKLDTAGLEKEIAFAEGFGPAVGEAETVWLEELRADVQRRLAERVLWPYDELQRLPTLSHEEARLLKIDDGSKRVWLAVGANEPFRHTAHVEQLVNGEWHPSYCYDADQVFAGSFDA